MSGVELSDFLLARISEDEADALAAGGAAWRKGFWRVGWGYDPADGEWVDESDEAWVSEVDSHETVLYDEGRPSSEQATHIARHDPARILAECEAKRRMAERYVEIRGRSQDGDIVERQTLSWVLCLLALPYASHPDYREAWRP